MSDILISLILRPTQQPDNGLTFVERKNILLLWTDKASYVKSWKKANNEISTTRIPYIYVFIYSLVYLDRYGTNQPEEAEKNALHIESTAFASRVWSATTLKPLTGEVNSMVMGTQGSIKHVGNDG